jgi:hypothetical protein
MCDVGQPHEDSHTGCGFAAPDDCAQARTWVVVICRHHNSQSHPHTPNASIEQRQRNGGFSPLRILLGTHTHTTSVMNETNCLWGSRIVSFAAV